MHVPQVAKNNVPTYLQPNLHQRVPMEGSREHGTSHNSLGDYHVHSDTSGKFVQNLIPVGNKEIR